MLFTNIYPGYNLETNVKYKDDNLLSEINMKLIDINNNSEYYYELVQDTPTTTIMKDEYHNVLSELELNIQEITESLIKIITSTLISALEKQKLEKQIPRETETETGMFFKPTFISPLGSKISTPVSYTPTQIKTAYNIPSPITGTNPIITIVIAYHYPNLQNDFAKFCSQYLNMKKAPLINIYSFGNQRDPTNNWSLEECLDIQWCYAMNTNATIQVVEAASDRFTDLSVALEFASNPTVPQKTGRITNGTTIKPCDIISMSWGTTEFSTENTCSLESTFTKYSNICYFASGGDSSEILYPAASPNVISVGGTSLLLSNANKRTTEKVWSSTGCGVSKVFKQPNYQKNTTTNIYRCDNDIAAVADPNTGVNVICSAFSNSPLIIGGTSASAPMCAGIFSLSIGCRKLNTSLKNLTTNTTSTSSQTKLLQTFIYNNRTSCFTDVSTGGSSSYTAKAGYDVPTGNGVPIGNILINALNAY